MSLDCYPFGKRRTIGLEEQPMALDVAYDDNLFVSVTNQCQSIVVYDLSAPDSSYLIRKFSLGEGIVVDQVNYCRVGDYLACIGHKNGLLAIYIVFNWRQLICDGEIEIFELDVNVESGNQDRREKLNSIDCCQRTGNLAASYGDLVLIYKYLHDDDNNNNNDTNGHGTDEHDLEVQTAKKVDTIEDDIQSNIIRSFGGNDDDATGGKKKHFEHMISVKLTIWASKICLLENYLSITAVDHVQVLKLELLTLQIQSDVLDFELANSGQEDIYGNQQANNNNSGSDPSTNYNAAQSETASTTSNTIGTTCSMISDSAATDLSSSNNNNGSGEQQLNNSDLSVITMSQGQQDPNDDDFDSNEIGGGGGGSGGDDSQNQSADDCITWNLNTKKLVKLPTLMHNTSKNLSSYHICHPLELLGPASESIACRVSGSIYSGDFCQNQLEPVVMLCKQFDFERDPVKSTYLKAVYLSSYEDKRRLSSKSNQHQHQENTCPASQVAAHSRPQAKEPSLMESDSYDLLASVTCFVTTLTTCFVYALHGEEVARSQTITYPDLCLDLRPDLLNAYLLTPMGLQICSTGICDSSFRYDWSSSADLNLSFIATSYGTRILTTTDYIILVACSVDELVCEVEFWEKPSLGCLNDRIVHTVNRCNSISIRSNLLTYLHAMSQLAMLQPIDDGGQYDLQASDDLTKSHPQDTVAILKTATIMLCKQLLQKKQANVITNSRIDKNIKHLLDISHCDLDELMKRKLQSNRDRLAPTNRRAGCVQSSASLQSLDNSIELLEGPVSFRQMARLARASTEPPPPPPPVNISMTMMMFDDLSPNPMDTDFELLKIYLKQAKFNQSILNYMISNLTDETLSKSLIGYMFEHNPRLLIKCAQRFPMRLAAPTTTTNGTPGGPCNLIDQGQVASCVMFLVDKLKLLAEFYSTGIDRATVLFTLASLYNALGEKQNCLNALNQIKPLNHLVITMSHNFDLSQSVAKVVQEHYPDVFNLFTDLARRKKQMAATALNTYV